ESDQGVERLRGGAVRVNAEYLCGGERSECQPADVEEELVDAAPPTAPFDDGGRQRDCERGARPDDGGTRECPHRAHGNRARSLDLDRERLSGAHEGDDRNEADNVEVPPHHYTGDSGSDAETADGEDEPGERPADPEEARASVRV